MDAGFELFDHTADIGVRVWAPTLLLLVEPATCGLYAVIGDLAAQAESQHVKIEFDGESASELLRDYLAEMLFAFEHDHRIAGGIHVEQFDIRRLRVDVAMHALDPQSSVFFREVKAVTYHDLTVAEVAGGVEATYILDI